MNKPGCPILVSYTNIRCVVSSMQQHTQSVTYSNCLQDRQQNGTVRFCHPGETQQCNSQSSVNVEMFLPLKLCPLIPQGNKEVGKSPKSPMADIPTGGTRSIKSMWEKGNVGSSSESPSPANKVRNNRKR